MAKVKAAYEKECGVEQKDEPELDEDTILANLELSVENNNLSAAEAFVKANEHHPQKAEIEAVINAAHRKVKGQITLLVDKSEGLGKEIAASVAGQIRGCLDEKAYALIVIDAKLLCECSSQAKYRMPPTRMPQLTRLIGAALESREGEGALLDGDVLIGIDGAKGRDWEEKLLKVVKQKHLCVTRNTLIYTQESMEKRMERASKAPLELTECINMISTDQVACKAPL